LVNLKNIVYFVTTFNLPSKSNSAVQVPIGSGSSSNSSFCSTAALFLNIHDIMQEITVTQLNGMQEIIVTELNGMQEITVTQLNGIQEITVTQLNGMQEITDTQLNGIQEINVTLLNGMLETPSLS